MRPGGKHIVLTPEPCLALGGHFFSSATLFASLEAIVLEHYFGDGIVNTTHTGSPAILLRLFIACMERDLDLSIAGFSKEKISNDEASEEEDDVQGK